MSQEQQAYEAGYRQGFERAYEEARAAIGPKWFQGNPTIAEGLLRRSRFEKRVKLVLNLIWFVPCAYIFWGVCNYANDLQERCSRCLCVGATK